MATTVEKLTDKFAEEVARQKNAPQPKKPSVVQKFQSAVKMVSNSTPAQKKQWVITGMRLAREVGNAVPGSNSTPFGAALQSIGAIDIARSILWKDTTDPVAQYANQFGMAKFTNETFVNIFFNTDLHTKFILFKVRVSDYKELIDAQGPLGRFAFTKSDYSERYDSTYYMRPDVQMTQVLEGLWTQYQGRLHVNVTSDVYGRGTAEFISFKDIDSPLFGGYDARMDKLIARHQKCQEQKIPRSYMFYGPPGTGKTSFAMKFADKLGKRTLKLGATSLANISVKDITYLLQHLSPEFLIIDDVDKIQTGNALPTLLEIVQRFKDGDGRATLLMSANTITNFDPGFLRPNRIDTWLEFKLPDKEERKEVLTAYTKQMGVRFSEGDIDILAQVSEGLSHDYLREIVFEMKRCGDFREVMDLTRLMKGLLLKVVPAKPEDKPKPETK
jgi:hypothetical protein